MTQVEILKIDGTFKQIYVKRQLFKQVLDHPILINFFSLSLQDHAAYAINVLYLLVEPTSFRLLAVIEFVTELHDDVYHTFQRLSPARRRQYSTPDRSRRHSCLPTASGCRRLLSSVWLLLLVGVIACIVIKRWIK